MLKNVSALVFSVLFACDSTSSMGLHPREFWLCNHPLPGAATIQLDYIAKSGTYSDSGDSVATCGDESDCISYPLFLAVPPRLPTGNETVRWSVAGHEFAITRDATSRSKYQIAVTPGHSGRSGVPLFASLHYVYDVNEGVIFFHSDGEADNWVRCRGRLTFGDLRELRQRLVPDFQYNPRTRPNVPPMSLETNTSIQAPH
jgi:hypothetical protein